MNLKNFSTFLLFLGFFFQTQAQILKNNTLNLSVNGIINDIEYIQSIDKYVVVGRFDTINGIARKNLAFLNPSNFSVVTTGTNFNPITSMLYSYARSEISSVTYFTNGTKQLLVIGGLFDEINGVSLNCLATLVKTTASTTDFFTLSPFDYEITPEQLDVSTSVHDVQFSNDTLWVASGSLGYTVPASNGSTSGTIYDDNDGVFAFKVSTNTSNPAHFYKVTIPEYLSSPSFASMNCRDIFFQNSSVFLAGGSGENTPSFINGYLKKMNKNPSLAIDSYFNSAFPTTNTQNWINGLVQLNDSIILGGGQFDDGTFSDLNVKNLFFLKSKAPFTTNLYYGLGADINFNLNSSVVAYTASDGWEVYNDEILMYQQSTNPKSLKRYQYTISGNTVVLTQTGSTLSINGTPNSTYCDSINDLKVVKNYLILTDRNLSQVNGSARKGAAIFCLEPKNPTGVITGSNPVCAGSIGDYSFNDVEYNTGYRINYSGTNAQFSFDNGVTWISTITNYMYVFAGTGAPVNFKIKYLDNATSGTITVTPFNTCNTTSDYQYARSLTLAITVNPKPTLNISASESMFNCIVDSTIIVATSNAVVPTYSWSWNLQNIGNNDSLIRFGSGVLAGNYPEGWYICNIVNENGCTNKDSVLITEDFTLPAIDVNNDVISNPASWTCNTTSMELNATIPNTSIYWTTLTDTTVQFSNPHTITSYLPSSFKIYVTSTVNGCTNNQTYQINDDQITIDGYLPNIGTNISFDSDTLNCAVDSLNIICAIWPSDPNAASGTIAWLVNGVETNDSLLVTLNDSINATNDILVLSYVTTNTINTCKDTNNLTIIFDTEVPFIGTTIGGTSINCSVDEVVLSHQQTGGQVSEGWLDNLGNQTFVDTLLATNTGDYFYEVTNLQNGCKSIDTVTVLQTNELYLSSTNDTLVCPGSVVNLQTSPINEVATFTYSWSSGGSSNQTSVTGSNQTVYVDVTSSTGCIGQDSIVVSITPPIVADFQDFIGCGDNSGSLQVVSATGGAGNYTYSINGGTFGTATLFEDLSIGQHQISIQDGLGCVYDFTDSISANAQGPELEFLVATFSQAGDTLALVNTTIFAGFDSVAWVFPAGITVTAQYDSLTFIHAADTGWYEVTLIGYIDTCSFNYTKEFHVDNTKPLYPEFGESLRIQSTLLFPNPTTGTFNLEVEFGVEQDYSIIVVNNLSQPIIGMSAKGDALTCDHTFSFPSGSIPGMYQVIILSTYDARTLQVELTQ